MGARNRVGIGLSYRPAGLHRLADLIPWHRFLGSIIRALVDLHCKKPIPKIRNKYTQKRNCAASVAIFNFHNQVSVRDLYIPNIDLLILLQEICGPILGIYKSLTDT
jgi:hypothetical protein